MKYDLQSAVHKPAGADRGWPHHMLAEYFDAVLKAYLDCKTKSGLLERGPL